MGDKYLGRKLKLAHEWSKSLFFVSTILDCDMKGFSCSLKIESEVVRDTCRSVS